MEPTISHLPLIDHASGIRNVDRKYRQRQPASYSTIELIIWMLLMFTLGLLCGIFY